MMQAIQVRLSRYALRLDSSEPVSTPVRALTRIFGCWHGQMNSPFTRNHETYRTCMECGARRHFDLGLSKMTGAYYYALPSALYGSPSPAQFAGVVKGQISRRPSSAASRAGLLPRRSVIVKDVWRVKVHARPSFDLANSRAS